MSLYNMVNGVKPGAFFLLPLLDKGHHPDDFPRFRDFFVGDEERPDTKDKFIVYTRTGGGNRDEYVDQNNWIRSLKGFLFDYDDSFDSTFACWIFEPPKEFEEDIEKYMKQDIKNMSKKAQQRVRKVYPKLKDQLDAIWGIEVSKKKK